VFCDRDQCMIASRQAAFGGASWPGLLEKIVGDTGLVAACVVPHSAILWSRFARYRSSRTF